MSPPTPHGKTRGRRERDSTRRHAPSEPRPLGSGGPARSPAAHGMRSGSPAPASAPSQPRRPGRAAMRAGVPVLRGVPALRASAILKRPGLVRVAREHRAGGGCGIVGKGPWGGPGIAQPQLCRSLRGWTSYPDLARPDFPPTRRLWQGRSHNAISRTPSARRRLRLATST
jgi:hypothetical protein